MNIEEKIGLRTSENTPCVTSRVRSCSSTPIRHESPMVACATSTSTVPVTASASPVNATPVSSRKLRRGNQPARSATGPISAAARASVNPRPAHHSSEPRVPEKPRNPADPVRMYCSALRSPNARAPNTA